MSKNAFSLRARALAACLVLLFLAPAARAVTLSGYREGAGNTPQECYQYVTFGRYPYERDGSQAPVLWRVLGPGTPEKADVIDAVNEPPRSWKKTGNGDDLSGDNADLVCLMTEYIVDALLYNGEKDTADGTPLDYENTAVYRTLNTQVLATLFTSEERPSFAKCRTAACWPCPRGGASSSEPITASLRRTSPRAGRVGPPEPPGRLPAASSASTARTAGTLPRTGGAPVSAGSWVTTATSPSPARTASAASG